jgi:hypothetical protein
VLARVEVASFEYTMVHSIPTVNQGCGELSEQFTFLQVQEIRDLLEQGTMRLMMPQVLELLKHERAPANLTSRAAGNRVGLARST